MTRILLIVQKPTVQQKELCDDKKKEQRQRCCKVAISINDGKIFLGVKYDSPLIPFGANVNYKPATTKHEARLHQPWQQDASWKYP